MALCILLGKHDLWQTYNMLKFSEKSIISNVLSFHLSYNDNTSHLCIRTYTYIHMCVIHAFIYTMIVCLLDYSHAVVLYSIELNLV